MYNPFISSIHVIFKHRYYTHSPDYCFLIYTCVSEVNLYKNYSLPHSFNGYRIDCKYTITLVAFLLVDDGNT